MKKYGVTQGWNRQGWNGLERFLLGVVMALGFLSILTLEVRAAVGAEGVVRPAAEYVDRMFKTSEMRGSRDTCLRRIGDY